MTTSIGYSSLSMALLTPLNMTYYGVVAARLGSLDVTHMDGDNDTTTGKQGRWFEWGL